MRQELPRPETFSKWALPCSTPKHKRSCIWAILWPSLDSMEPPHAMASKCQLISNSEGPTMWSQLRKMDQSTQDKSSCTVLAKKWTALETNTKANGIMTSEVAKAR